MDSTDATGRLDDLWQMVERQQTEIQRLTAEGKRHTDETKRLHALLAERPEAPSAAPERARARRLSRSGLLKVATAGAVGLAAASLAGRPDPAFAGTDGDVVVGGYNVNDLGMTQVAVSSFPVGQETYPSLQGTSGLASGDHDGVRGLASGAGNGVAGYGGGSSGTGVYGSGGAGDGSGVSGTGNYAGVQGNSTGGWGVQGNSTNYFGVSGYSSNYVGVEGNAGKYGGYFVGGLAPIYLQPGGTAGAPTTGAHNSGEIYVDTNGVFWICVALGTPGTWKQLATTTDLFLLGLQPFPTPRRVYKNPGALSGTTYGPIDATHDTHGNLSGVPAGARAMYAAVQSYHDGTMTLFPSGTTDPGIANYSVGGVGSILRLLYMLVPLNASGQFSIHTYFNGDIYVDAWGYLL